MRSQSPISSASQGFPLVELSVLLIANSGSFSVNSEPPEEQMSPTPKDIYLDRDLHPSVTNLHLNTWNRRFHRDLHNPL